MTMFGFYDTFTGLYRSFQWVVSRWRITGTRDKAACVIIIQYKFLYKEGSQLRLNESVHPLHLIYICERKQTNKEKDKQKSQKEHLRSILQHCSFKFVVKLWQQEELETVCVNEKIHFRENGKIAPILNRKENDHLTSSVRFVYCFFMYHAKYNSA